MQNTGINFVDQLGLLTQEIVSLCRTRRHDESLEFTSARLQKARQLETALRQTAASARGELAPGSKQLADILDDESTAFESLSSLCDGDERARLERDARQSFDQSLKIRMSKLGGRLAQAALGNDQLK
jgi:hypothetical protein